MFDNLRGHSPGSGGQPPPPAIGTFACRPESVDQLLMCVADQLLICVADQLLIYVADQLPICAADTTLGRDLCFLAPGFEKLQCYKTRIGSNGVYL